MHELQCSEAQIFQFLDFSHSLSFVDYRFKQYNLSSYSSYVQDRVCISL